MHELKTVIEGPMDIATEQRRSEVEAEIESETEEPCEVDSILIDDDSEYSESGWDDGEEDTTCWKADNWDPNKYSDLGDADEDEDSDKDFLLDGVYDGEWPIEDLDDPARGVQ